MNALAAANESATQMFGNIAIFPPGAEPEPFVPAPKKGKHPGYAQVSTNGQPSFYAQVGPNGVSFVSSE
jgi:hypothetical protein